MSDWNDLRQVLLDCLPETTAAHVLEQIHKRCGGCQPYIPSKPEISVKPTDTPETIRKRTGVSRSTAYNWINRYRL